MKTKVVIVGAGFVGSTIAYAMMLEKIAEEIYLIDTNAEKCQGEINDISHGFTNISSTKIIKGTYSDCANSNLIVITAGRNRKRDESRIDLLNDNIEIIKKIYTEILPYVNKTPIMIVTNPVDVLVQNFSELLDCFDGQVFGTGCILDSSRF